MARIRSLKPEAFQSETLSEVSVNAERTFFGLSTQVDDRGRIADKPVVLNAALWAVRSEREPHTAKDLDGELEQLVAVGLVCRYIGCDGKRYLHLVSWDDHQKVDKASRSRVPRCPHHLSERDDCGKHEKDPCPPVESREAPKTFASPREDSANSREDSANGFESSTLDLGPRTLDRGSLPPAAAVPSARGEETPNQRANRLAKVYTDRVQPSNFPAVAKIVRKAVDADCSDELITAGLNKLADDGRSCTTDSLRIAMYGPPRNSNGNGSNFANGTGARAHTPTAEELAKAKVNL